MVPFIPNQSSPAPPRPSASHHHQVPGPPSNMFANLAQIQPQMGFINPQLSNPFNNNGNSSNNNNSNGFNSNMGNGVRSQGFMNMPNFNALQPNRLLGSGSFQGLPQQFQSQPGFCPPNFGQNSGFMGLNMIPGNGGQFGGWQNQGQNMNQLTGVMLNPAQVAALSQLMGCVNQVAQGMVPQNGGFPGNPQLGLVQPNGGLQQQGNFGQQMPVGSQQLQNVPGLPSMPFNPALAQLQNNQSHNLQNQESHVKKQGGHFPNARHNQNKNCTKNPREGASNWRPQNTKTQQMNKEGKEIESAGPENSSTQTNSGNRKPLFLLYTDKEIQKWREERKKNYPTKDNFQKKLSQKQANADAAAEDAKLRRQQLKEVLAKQAELGLDVPEIPSHYLLENEDLSHGKGKYKRPLNNGRHQNKFNKRGRFNKNNRFPSKRRPEDELCGENEHFATKPKEENYKNCSKTPAGEPTLLQKLLTADIKRDNSRLLQSFRFMVMNSFFNEKTDEPLNFPKVVVEERVEGDDKESSLKELNGGIEVRGVCHEEGEIAD